MGQARHPLSLALAVLAASLCVLLGSGCGSSSENTEGSPTSGGGTTSKAPLGASAQSCAVTVTGISGLRVSGVGCSAGQDIALGWDKKGSCRAPAGASRASCDVGGYRCLGAATERGLAIGCAGPGRSISFVVKRG